MPPPESAGPAPEGEPSNRMHPTPPARPDDAHLWDMLQAAREVRQFVSGRTFEDYTRDVALRRAVERSVEIIGEACRRVSRGFCNAHPAVPWKKIAGQRHRLAHEYDTIDHGTIWRVATVHVPVLIDALEALLPPAPKDGAGADA